MELYRLLNSNEIKKLDILSESLNCVTYINEYGFKRTCHKSKFEEEGLFSSLHEVNKALLKRLIQKVHESRNKMLQSEIYLAEFIHKLNNKVPFDDILNLVQADSEINEELWKIFKGDTYNENI